MAKKRKKRDIWEGIANGLSRGLIAKAPKSERSHLTFIASGGRRGKKKK